MPELLEQEGLISTQPVMLTGHVLVLMKHLPS